MKATAEIRAAALAHVALLEQVARDGNAASQHARGEEVACRPGAAVRD